MFFVTLSQIGYENTETSLHYSLEELLNQSSSQVRVSAEVEELKSQLSRLNIRNKELELQNSGRSNDHARMLKQVPPQYTCTVESCLHAQTCSIGKITSRCSNILSEVNNIQTQVNHICILEQVNCAQSYLGNSQCSGR